MYVAKHVQTVGEVRSYKNGSRILDLAAAVDRGTGLSD